MASPHIHFRFLVETEVFEHALLTVERTFLEENIEEAPEWTPLGCEARERLQWVRDRLAVLDLILGNDSVAP